MTPAGASHKRDSAELLERGDELSAIDRLLDRASAGQGGLTVVLGSAGMGKSALLSAARRRGASQGFRCLTARGSELEAEFAYGVARQLFERTLTDLDAAELSDVLSGAARLAAPVLSLDPQPSESPAGPDAQFTALHGLYWVCVNLGQRGPILLTVDDAHWVDGVSLRFLTYLASRIHETPTAMLVATRSAEPAVDQEALDALIRDSSDTLTPAPLTADATERLLRQRLDASPASQFLEAVQAATAGNPFLVTSLVSTLRDQLVEPTAEAAAIVAHLGVDEIGRHVVARLARMRQPVRVLADAVAVLNNDVEIRHAAALAGQSLAEASESADVLAAHELLYERRPLEFVHPIVRAAVYRGMTEGARATFHARAAAILAGEGAPPERVAAHWLASEPAGDAVVVEGLRRAARSARDRGAAESAVRYLRRAMAEPPSRDCRTEVVYELGSAEASIGDPSGVDHLRDALEGTDDPPVAAKIARELSLALAPRGEYAEAVEVLAIAAGLLGSQDRELSMELEADIAVISRLGPATTPTASRLDRFEKLEGSTATERALLGSLAIERSFGDGSARDVAELVTRALEGPGLSWDRQGFYDAIFAAMVAESYDLARRAIDDALVDARARGSRFGVAHISAFLAAHALRRGDISEAVSAAEDSIELTQPPWLVGMLAAGFLTEALIEQGRIETAAKVLENAGALGELPDTFVLNFVLHSRGVLRIAEGSHEHGIADLREFGVREDRRRGRNPAWFPYRSEIAIALARRGSAEEAQRLATEELALARAWGAPRAIGVALRGLAIAEGPEHGVDRMHAAVDVLSGSGAELELARTLVDLGGLLRRAGQRKASMAPLRAGMDLAHRRGATALVAHARDELVAAGARPRRLVLRGVDALTPSEARVARLAADGRTNREIAEALFVTMRTVEVHLTHAYQKLGINSRDDLPTALSG